MNIFDIMSETKVNVGLSNYSIRIMGNSGKGKTSLYSYFAKELSKREYGGQKVCALIPLEDRYNHIDGLIILRPTLKDNMGRPVLDENGKPKTKKIVETWEDFVEIVDMLVDAKKTIPDFPIQRVCIDTTTKLEMLAQERVVRLNFEVNKKLQDFNEVFGGYGRGYTKAIEVTREQKQKLIHVGYKVDQCVQTRVKSQVQPISGMEYHINSSDSAEGYDGKVFLQDADISFHIVEEAIVKQTGAARGKVLNGMEIQGKVLVLDSDGEYKGCKSPFPNTPKTLQADDFEECMKNYFDLFETRMSEMAGIKKEDYNRKVELEKNNQMEVLKDSIKLDDINKHQDDKSDNIKRFIEYFEGIKPQMPSEALKQWNDYFMELIKMTQSNDLLEALNKIDDNSLSAIYQNLNFK